MFRKAIAKGDAAEFRGITIVFNGFTVRSFPMN